MARLCLDALVKDMAIDRRVEVEHVGYTIAKCNREGLNVNDAECVGYRPP
jgi:hypothetical protein